MKRTNCAVLCLLSLALTRIAAETTRLPFIAPEAAYAEPGASTAFPAFASWLEFAHTLNQEAAPDTAQYLDTGAILTFWASDRLSVAGVAREILQFKASPEGAWYFWTRALVTDLALEVSFPLEPFEATAGYRHDCKHDAGPILRDVIHDALFARLAVRPSRRAALGFECEANVPTVFQDGPEESDRFRVSVETEAVPFESAGGSWRAFAGGRVSLIVRERGDRVAVDSVRNVDWLARVGGEYRAGLGRVRLFYGLERLSDDWADLDPAPQVTSAVHLLVFFSADANN